MVATDNEMGTKRCCRDGLPWEELRRWIVMRRTTRKTSIKGEVRPFLPSSAAASVVSILMILNMPGPLMNKNRIRIMQRGIHGDGARRLLFDQCIASQFLSLLPSSHNLLPVYFSSWVHRLTKYTRWKDMIKMVYCLANDHINNTSLIYCTKHDLSCLYTLLLLRKTIMS